MNLKDYFLLYTIFMFYKKSQVLIIKICFLMSFFAVVLICQCQAVLSVEKTKFQNINKGMSSFVLHFCLLMLYFSSVLK